MSKKVLLIVPPVRKSQKPTRFPLGLGYIAATLERDGFSVSVLDLNILRLSKREEETKITETIKGVDVVGMGGMITMYKTISDFASIIKRTQPDLPVMVGGPLTSHFQEIILKNSKIDVLVMGEGEQSVSKVANALVNKGSLEEIKGTAFFDGDEFFLNYQTERIKDLDTLPMPAYHLFPFETYMKNRGEPRVTDIIGSRGCPFKCSFCHRNFGNQVVFRSVESIIDEIRFLKHFYDIKHIHLEDELFVLKKNFVSDFCGKIRDIGGMTWSACARANTVNQEILQQMKSAGCQNLMIGLESFSEDRLKEMGKGVSLEQNEQACRLMNKIGIGIYPGLIIGMPGETEESIQETVNGCIRHKIPLTIWNYAFATPYPGTELYMWAKEQGHIKDDLRYIERLCEVGDTSELAVNLTTFKDKELICLRSRVIEVVNRRIGVKRDISGLGMIKQRLDNFSRRTVMRVLGKVSSLHSEFAGKKGMETSLFGCVQKQHFISDSDPNQAKRLFKESVTMVEVEVFSFCNRRCWFCPNSFIDRHSENYFMEENVYLKILGNLKEIEYRGEISYSRYNEPLAHDIIFTRLLQAKEVVPGACLHLNTNGDYLNVKVLKKLYSSGLRSMSIQVYLPENEKYSDKSTVGELMSKIKKLGLPSEFSFSQPMNWLEYRIFYEDMKIRIYSRNFSENGVDRGGIIRNFEKGRIRESPCLIPFVNMYIDYNGSVVPCCNIRSDVPEHGEILLGNLNDPNETLFSIFSSSKMTFLRKKLIEYGHKDWPCTYCLFQEIPSNPDNLRFAKSIKTDVDNFDNKVLSTLKG